MVIVQLKGGLGNQMFQYAAARRLAAQQNIELKLDLSFLEADTVQHTKRDFELYKLNINAGIATRKEIQAIKKQRWKNLFRPVLIKDKGVADFSKKIARCSNHVYLDGYWQSERYFGFISSIIRDEFTFKQPIDSDYFLKVKHQIENSDSISLHFRRGDYVENPKTNKYHGVSSMSYYQKAVERITKKTNDPTLFIFSDDIQWVMAHFESEFPMVFIEQSDEGLHSDFRLMSICKHNIIANSTYSWWAAWLNENENKTVIAPEKWYEHQRSQVHVSDLLPKEWITL